MTTASSRWPSQIAAPPTVACRRFGQSLQVGRAEMTEAVVLLGCGDVGPIHEPMEQYSELVRDTLAAADIRFAQVERVYSERGELQPHGGAHGRLPPHMLSVITA